MIKIAVINFWLVRTNYDEQCLQDSVSVEHRVMSYQVGGHACPNKEKVEDCSVTMPKLGTVLLSGCLLHVGHMTTYH